MALQSISVHDRIEFGGKRILFVDDLLHLPPLVLNPSRPAAYRLITCLLYWLLIQTLQLQQPMKVPDPARVGSFFSIAKGNIHDIQD
jgi:hypothetical protein